MHLLFNGAYSDRRMPELPCSKRESRLLLEWKNPTSSPIYGHLMYHRTITHHLGLRGCQLENTGPAVDNGPVQEVKQPCNDPKTCLQALLHCSVIIGRNPIEAKEKSDVSPYTGKSFSLYFKFL